MAIDRYDERLPMLTGQGRYVDDITPEGCLYAAFLRSPHARARITHVDTAAAQAAAGVKGVFIGSDLAGDVLPIEARMDEADWYSYQQTAWPIIAIDEVRYVGEVVAAVIATDRYLAEDACALVEIDFEPEPAVVDAASAVAEDTPRVHERLPGNTLFECTFQSDSGAEAFESAAVRVTGSFRHPRVSPAPLECCGAVAIYDRRHDTFEIWASNQVPHMMRDGLARCLKHPETHIRVSTPDVGGGFGGKMQLYPEEVIIAYAARALARPMKWTQDRLENLRTCFPARDAYIEAELAADEEGRILGLSASLWCDVGAYSSFPLGCSLEPHTALVGLPGPYDIRYVDYKAYAVATNKCPTGAYRGVGFALAPLVTESLLDKMARRLGMDRVEIRRRNLVQPGAFPFKSAAGAIYDSGSYPDLVAKALDSAGYHELVARKRSSTDGTRRLGIGISCFIEPTAMGCNVFRSRGMREIPAFDSALVRVNRSGSVEAYVTTPTQGQLQFTSMRLVLSQMLGIPTETIVVRSGDTVTMPYGSGTFASRGTVTGGGALRRATRKVVDKMKYLAALSLDVEVGNIVFEDGRFANGKNSNQVATFEDIAAFAHSPVGGLPADFEHGLQCTASYDNPGAAISAAAHIAVVEVDTLTGEVRVVDFFVAEDCGPIINLDAVEGQTRGAVVQGIGAALLEEVIYDDWGQPQSGTLAEYLIPTSCECPDFGIVHQETPSPLTEGGHKGMGESGTIGAPAAIASAVMDALDVDWSEIRLPLTPERIQTLWAERAGSDADRALA